MKWTYYKATEPLGGTTFWCVFDGLGTEFQIDTRGEAHSLCHYLNKKQFNGKFEDIDQAFSEWRKKFKKSS